MDESHLFQLVIKCNENHEYENVMFHFINQIEIINLN